LRLGVAAMEDGAPAAPVRRRPSSTVSEAFGPAAAAAALERQRRASAPSLLSLPSLTLSANDGRRLAAVAAQDRGRVAFRGSITVHNAPGGRCSLDPKLSFVASPGPVTAAPLDFGGIVVPGVAFGRLTEHKNATAVPRAAVLAEPRGRAAKREATIELYGRAHAGAATGAAAAIASAVRVFDAVANVPPLGTSVRVAHAAPKVAGPRLRRARAAKCRRWGVCQGAAL